MDGPAPELHVTRTNSRSWTDAQLASLFADGFPEFIVGDVAVHAIIPRIRESFPAFDITLVDRDLEPAATGWRVPLAWSGETSALPPTFAEVLGRSLDLFHQGGAADTLVVCGAVVRPDHKGRGVAEQLLRALCQVATDHDLARVVAPVRPTRKETYPLLAIEDYVALRRSDGLPWDPWLRLHVRMGATITGVAPRAQTMTGTVAQWREWTGLEFPTSGDYIIPRGMAPLHIDRALDLGTYVEPNVWVRHR